MSNEENPPSTQPRRPTRQRAFFRACMVLLCAILIRHEFRRGQCIVQTVGTPVELSTQQAKAPPMPNFTDYPYDISGSLNHYHDNNFQVIQYNETDYTWIGNHYIPPEGIPLYTLRQMRDYFAKKSVLVLGDSTGRRAYGTLYAMLDKTQNPTHRYQETFQENELERSNVIDVGRAGRDVDLGCQQRHPRDFNNITSNRGRIWESKTNPDFICRAMPSSDMWESKHYCPTHHRYFDYGKLPCFKHVTNYVHHEMTMYNSSTFHDYDMIVLALGLWDVARPRYCKEDLSNSKETSLDRVTTMIHSLHNWILSVQNSTWSPTIVVRTIGFDQRGYGTAETKGLNRRIVELINQHNNNGNTNLRYVDWGGAIEPRSFGTNRIQGDIAEHYGLQARTLFIQMLMHKLLVAPPPPPPPPPTPPPTPPHTPPHTTPLPTTTATTTTTTTTKNNNITLTTSAANTTQ